MLKLRVFEGALYSMNRISGFCDAYVDPSGELLQGSVDNEGFRPFERFLRSRQPPVNARAELSQLVSLSDCLVQAPKCVLGPRESLTDVPAEFDRLFARSLEGMLRSTEPTVDSDVESLQRRTLSDIAQLVQRLLGAHEPRLEIAAQTMERLLCNNQLRFLVA